MHRTSDGALEMAEEQTMADTEPEMVGAPVASEDASKPNPTIEDIKIALYEHCCSFAEGTVFSQQDFLKTSLIPDNSVHTLQIVTENLARTGRLKLMQYPDGKVFWRHVPLETLQARSGLDRDAILVLSHIESAGREGIWTVTLKKKTGLHKVVVDKAIKALEHRVLIKPVSNARHPGRKTWMLWGLQPFEAVTGGLFFSEGDLDEEFVRVMTQYIERWVSVKSWWYPSEKEARTHGKKKRRLTDSLESQQDAESLRAKVLEQPSRSQLKHMRPFPAGYSKYPTISDIANAVNDSKLSKSKLRTLDAQALVDILVWDGRFEKIPRSTRDAEPSYRYRNVRQPYVADEEKHVDTEVAGATALTEAPCGRCPVFDDCEDGGLVSARTCPYFQDWLTI